MARPATRKQRPVSPICPDCGEECAVIWMKDGSTVLASKQKIEIIFTNYANASGHTHQAWVRHVCKKGKKK
jgi:hypothetical protein